MTRTTKFSGSAFIAVPAILIFSTGALAQQENKSGMTASPTTVEIRASDLRQLSLARSLMQGKQWDEAIDAFKRSAAASSDDVATAARAGLSHAIALRRKSIHDEAAETNARKLRLGQAFLEAGDWDKAIAVLAEVAVSENVTLAEHAREGIITAIRDKESGLLGIRGYLTSPLDRWWPIDYLVSACAFGIGLLFLGLIWRRWFGPFLEGILAACFKRTFDWKVTVAGSAQPEHRNAAFDEFVITMRELRRHQDDGGISPAGIGQLRFFAPLSVGDMIGPDLKVQGFDVGRVAVMLQTMWAFYTYQFEIRVETIDGKAYVNAILRWGGRTEKVWQLPTLSEDTNTSYREIGQKLAFTVYGDTLVRT